MSRNEEFASGQQTPRVFKRADRVFDDTGKWLPGTQPNTFEVWNGPDHPMKESGGREIPDTTVVAGRPLEKSDLPDELFHVSTNLPGIQKSGMIKAATGGELAGLGGSHREVVSLTTDRGIAQSLESDMRDYGTHAPTGDVEGVMTHLHDEYEKHGMLDKFGEQQKYYDRYKNSGGSDPFGNIETMYSLFHSHRQRATGTTMPLILGGISHPQSAWHHVDPDNVGTVTVPRSAIPDETLVANFDLNRPEGLQEVRVHGDIPLRQVRS